MRTPLGRPSTLWFLAFAACIACGTDTDSGPLPDAAVASGGSTHAGGAPGSGASQSAGGTAPASGGSESAGGAAPGSGGTSQAASVPEGTEEAMAAFIEAQTYREAPWTAETPMPREEFTGVSPHDRVRVWLNDVAIASAEAGNGLNIDAPPHEPNSMAVKEFYDESDQRVGIAAILKLDGDKNAAAYYCDGPPERCGALATPYFGTGLTTECGFCHGGLLYTLTDAEREE